MIIDVLIPSFLSIARNIAVHSGSPDPDDNARSLVFLCDWVFGLGFLSALLVVLLFLFSRGVWRVFSARKALAG